MWHSFELAKESQFNRVATQKTILKQTDIWTIPYDEKILSTELECCYKEFVYYRDIAKNDVAALGWAVSYNLQALWQNSTKVDTINNFDIPIRQTKPTTTQEIKQLQEIQSFLQNKGINPLKLYYISYPKNIESNNEKYLRQMAENFSHNTTNISLARDKKREIRFYTTLDWDRFYMKFPLVKKLSKNLNNVNMIYTKNFLKGIEYILSTDKNKTRFNELPNGEYIFDFAIDVRDSRSEENVKSYIIVKENDKVPQGYKFVSQCEPYELDTLNCQHKSIEDDDFFYQSIQNLWINIAGQFGADISAAFIIKQTARSIPVIGQGILAYEAYNLSKEINQQTYNNIMQDLSLYACSGKFSLYFAPTKLSIKKEIKHNKSKIQYRIDEMVAYVYDSFDFLDQPHIFNDNGEIIKLGQPVGAWDFNTKEFSILGSIRQMATYKMELELGLGLNISDILQSPQTKQYYIYNQDYQDYQKFTNYGLDFKLYSSSFIQTIDCSNQEFKDLDLEFLI